MARIMTTLMVVGLMEMQGQALRISDISVPSVVRSGTEVRLSCSYETSPDRPAPLYSLKWYRGLDQFYQYMPQKQPKVRVFQQDHLHVDESQSDGSVVVLRDVTREASGSYRCELVGDKPYFETDERIGNMTVVDVPTSGPNIRNIPIGKKVTPDDVLDLLCVVGQSDPPVEVTWYINDHAPPRHAHIIPSTTTDKLGKRIHVSRLQLTVRSDSFRRGAMVVTCEAKVLTAFRSTANLTLVDATWPVPADLGWFSSGTSQGASVVVVVAVAMVSMLATDL